MCKQLLNRTNFKDLEFQIKDIRMLPDMVNVI